MNRRPTKHRTQMTYEEMIHQYERFYRTGMGPSPKLNSGQKWTILLGADGQMCPICSTRMVYYQGECFGTHDKPDAATVDHFLPRATGGTNDPKNLIPVCNACNHARGDTLHEVLKLSRPEDEFEQVKLVLHWHWLQLNDPVKGALLYPHHQDLFEKQWSHYFGDKRVFSTPKIIIGSRPGRTNMSASARKSRQLNFQLGFQSELSNEKKTEEVRE